MIASVAVFSLLLDGVERGGDAGPPVIELEPPATPKTIDQSADAPAVLPQQASDVPSTAKDS